MQGAVHPQLLSGHETVHLGMIEVEHLGELGMGHAVRADLPHGNAIAQHLVLRLVDLQQGIAHEGLFKRFNGFGDVSFIHPLVELDERFLEVALQQHIVVAIAPKGAAGPELLIVKAVVDIPTEAREQLAGRLLHGLFFGITVLWHIGPPTSYFCGR